MREREKEEERNVIIHLDFGIFTQFLLHSAEFNGDENWFILK